MGLRTSKFGYPSNKYDDTKLNALGEDVGEMQQKLPSESDKSGIVSVISNGEVEDYNWKNHRNKKLKTAMSTYAQLKQKIKPKKNTPQEKTHAEKKHHT